MTRNNVESKSQFTQDAAFWKLCLFYWGKIKTTEAFWQARSAHPKLLFFLKNPLFPPPCLNPACRRALPDPCAAGFRVLNYQTSSKPEIFHLLLTEEPRGWWTQRACSSSGSRKGYSFYCINKLFTVTCGGKMPAQSSQGTYQCPRHNEEQWDLWSKICET